MSVSGGELELDTVLGQLSHDHTCSSPPGTTDKQALVEGGVGDMQLESGVHGQRGAARAIQLTSSSLLERCGRANVQ